MRALGIFAFASFIATIFAANWLIENVGIVSVGFGLMAPAGVFMVGIAFTCRDLLQRTLGVRWTVAAVLIGAALSAFVSPAFAFASGVAFLVSELADLTVYTPLERKSWLGAVGLSNTVGLLVDSWLFLTLAFGSLEFFWGQVVGKAWMTLAAVVVLWMAQRAVLARRASA
jgi:queuosine precursor transporter